MINETETKYPETENLEVKVFTLEDDAIEKILRDALNQEIDLTGSLISVIVQLPENQVALGIGTTPHGDHADDVGEMIDLDKISVPLSSIQLTSAAFLTAEGSTLHSVRVGSVTRSVLHKH